MEFFDWSLLGSYAGAALAVAVLTQITKGIPGIVRIPTQLWSYVLALVTLLLALIFGPGFSASGAVLALFNAALVSLAANGGYAAVERAKAGLESGKEQD
ncbi:MAG: hypothetical protein SPH82_00140 [Eubacteriales bacterium]|nr:hypothetical protein [Eubacteriales bacterium]